MYPYYIFAFFKGYALVTPTRSDGGQGRIQLDHMAINRVGSNDGGKRQAPKHRMARQSHSTARHSIDSTRTHAQHGGGPRTHVTSRVAIRRSRLQQITDGSERGQVNCREGWPDILTSPSPLLSQNVLGASASASGWSYGAIGSVVVERGGSGAAASAPAVAASATRAGEEVDK